MRPLFLLLVLVPHGVAGAVYWEPIADSGTVDLIEQHKQPTDISTNDEENSQMLDEAEVFVGQAEIRFQMGDIDFRAEPEALLQIVERIGTIKKGLALYRTTNELSTAFTSNLLLTSVVGYSGTQYLVRALSAAKHDVRISIAGVDGAIRLLIHDHDNYREELASFGRLLPLWQAIELGYLCDAGAQHDELRESAKGSVEHIASIIDAKLHQVNSTSTIRLERDISKMLKALRRPAETVAQSLQLSLP